MGEALSKQVAVYLQSQTPWSYPCDAGEPCGICVAHKHGKKRKTPCPFRQPTMPAYWLGERATNVLCRDGLAMPVGRFMVQLTFSRLAHLRDRSLKIDEAFLSAYAAGERWARNLFDDPAGYDGKADAPRIVWTQAQMAESREQIRSFA